MVKDGKWCSDNAWDESLTPDTKHREGLPGSQAPHRTNSYGGQRPMEGGFNQLQEDCFCHPPVLKNTFLSSPSLTYLPVMKSLTVDLLAHRMQVTNALHSSTFLSASGPHKWMVYCPDLVNSSRLLLQACITATPEVYHLIWQSILSQYHFSRFLKICLVCGFCFVFLLFCLVFLKYLFFIKGSIQLSLKLHNEEKLQYQANESVTLSLEQFAHFGEYI